MVMTEDERMVLSAAAKQGKLLLSAFMDVPAEVHRLVACGHLVRVAHHDFGENVVLFELTPAGQLAAGGLPPPGRGGRGH
jgi:hypothetical protein